MTGEAKSSKPRHDKEVNRTTSDNGNPTRGFRFVCWGFGNARSEGMEMDTAK